MFRLTMPNWLATHPSVNTTNPNLLRATHKSFTSLVPVFYISFIGNAWILGLTQANRLSPILWLWSPLLLTAVAVWRIAKWKNARTTALSDQKIRQALARKNWIAFVFAMLVSAWSISLYVDGSPYEREQVLCFIGVNVIVAVMSLIHMRSAALIFLLTVVGSAVALIRLQHNENVDAAVVNLLFEASTVVFLIFYYHREFAELVESREAAVQNAAAAKALSDENFALSHLDSLTGLANRRWFFSELEAKTVAAREGGGRVAVGVLDLDGFKALNDVYGHPVGDLVLMEAGRRISAAVHPGVLVARLGGDEFGLICGECSGESGLLLMEQEIAKKLRGPFYVDGVTVNMSASIGIAGLAQPSDEEGNLFEQADYALYQAKRAGKDRCVVFSSELAQAARARANVEVAFKRARLDDELSLVYQPIVHVKTGATVGFEALARWDSPELGRISPAIFIPIAERAGIITRVTQFALREALAVAATWPSSVRVSVNLSALDVCSEAGVFEIVAIILGSAVDPRRIDLEITETVLMHDFEKAVANISALKAIGVSICIDDFGTGFSSLAHLSRLPVDKIKIDRRFVVALEQENNRKLLRGIRAIGNDMGLCSIVEGVETRKQLEEVGELGFERIQGYYFSEPMSAEATGEWLSDPDVVGVEKRRVS
jgi:diguanylate cyclase (GGDEF)-like protein